VEIVNLVLTFLRALAYFLGCRFAFLLDRGALLFDNRYECQNLFETMEFSSANGE